MKQNLLLLGGFGFLGTNIIKWIDAHCADRYDVIVFDRFPAHLDDVQFQSVVKVYSGDFTWTHHDSNALDVQSFKLNLGLLHSLLPNYRPTPFEEGLAKTLEWYRTK